MSLTIEAKPKMRRILVTVPQILNDQDRDVTVRELRKAIQEHHFGGEDAKVSPAPTSHKRAA